MERIAHACRIWAKWRSFQKRLLPFIQTLDDLDILLEICSQHGDVRPVTMMGLVRAGISPPNTLRRHLRALISNGVVLAKRSKQDGRVTELSLTSRGVRLVNTAVAQLNIMGESA